MRLGGGGGEGGPPTVSVSQLSSFSILCRRLLLTATVTRRAMIATRGRGEGNHLQVLGEKRLWKRSAAGLPGLNLSADCAFNAPAMSSWSAARLEGQTHVSAAQAIQQQRCGFHFFPFCHDRILNVALMLLYTVCVHTSQYYAQKCSIGIIGITHKPSTQYIKIHWTVLLSQRSEN